MKKFFILNLFLGVSILFAQQDQNRVQHSQPDIKEAPDTISERSTVKKARPDQMPVMKTDTNVVHPHMNVKRPRNMEPMPVKKLSDTIK